MDPRYNPQRTMQTNGGDWLAKLNQIREARQEFEKIERMLTPYEKQSIYGNIKADAEANRGKIYQGVKARLDAAVNGYKAAAARRAGAIAKEINSWDANKLNSELQAFQTRVGMELGKRDAQGILSGQPAAAGIASLYREAIASGDRYKQRAAAEVLRAMDTSKLPSEQRADVLMLSRAAIDNLEALRNTEEIKAAIEQENAAVKVMQDEQRFVKDAGAVMFEEGSSLMGRELGDFGKLASTIRFERSEGSVKINILGLDDPAITGIDWSESSLTQLKNEQEG